MRRVISNLDGEKILQSAPKQIASILAVLSVSALFWQQSVSLYTSSGFSQSKLVAVGAIIMMVGFASLHAMSKSKPALLLCVYMCGYEAYFVVAGTYANEASASLALVESSPDYVFLKLFVVS